MMADERFDAPLLGILQNCGELDPFLDTVIGFLYRKTDFFRPLAEDKSMGFPPGAAKKKLLKIVNHYEQLSTALIHPPKSLSQNILTETKPVPSVLTASGHSPKLSSNCSNGSVTSTSSAIASNSNEKTDKTCVHAITSSWDHHNGGATDQYAWSQTAQDVDLRISLPDPTVPARNIKVDIRYQHIDVRVRSGEGLETVLSGKLHSTVKPEDSVWSLHKGEFLHISFEKGRDGYWWTAMMEEGPGIKLDEIDTTRSIGEFASEEQACVQKLLFDERQKRQGLPTSQELETENILKKAWDAEGSPFAGTPFDPSLLQVSDSIPTD